jgi:DNA-binding MarR family transcriptional regulator
MHSKAELEKQVLAHTAAYSINVVLLRNAMGRALGLNLTESECWRFVSIKGAATPTEVAHYTGLTSGATTAMLDRLEQAGFITRRQNPADRRSVLIEMNPKATEMTLPLVAGIQAAHRELIASYSDQELAVIADFLARLTDNVTTHTKIIEKDQP